MQQTYKPVTGQRSGKDQRCGSSSWLGNKRRAAILAACLGATLLSGCESDEEIKGHLKPVKGFAGLVAADEPRAVQIGRELLGNGATAVDAAVAMYFAMTATMPSRVGIGGGGVCTLYDSEKNEAKVVEFLPQASKEGGAVPTAPRVMAAMHARYGTVRWQSLVSYGEKLARFGNPVSRAFAYDLALANKRLKINAELLANFTRSDGRLPREGDILVQPELSGVLAGLRSQGVGYLYEGKLTRRYAEASTAAGLPLSAASIRGYLPSFQEPLAVTIGDDVGYFSGPVTKAGLVSAEILGMLNETGDYDVEEKGASAHLFVEAAKRAHAVRGGIASGALDAADSLSEEGLEKALADFNDAKATPVDQLPYAPVSAGRDPYAAGFAIADRYNSAVSCSFTLNGLFGSGRMSKELGVVFAAPPHSQADGQDNLLSVVVANKPTSAFRFAGTASGGASGTLSLAKVMADVLLSERPLREAMEASRLHHNGNPDMVFYEKDGAGDLPAQLEQRGHVVRPAPPFGRVNAAYCAENMKNQPQSCTVSADSRGYGLGRRAQ